MKLIKGITKGKFINMDMIVDVWENSPKYFCGTVDGSIMEIPESSFRAILGYGKAEV